jgi:hypothetical protein
MAVLNMYLIIMLHMIFIYLLLGQITPPEYHNIIPRQNLTDAQKKAILQSLAQYESEYDANVSMIKQNYSYHTGTHNTNYRGHTVHATRVAADYAVDLLDCEDSVMEKRAFDVLRKLLSLQDVRPNSSTHGLWAYYLEEPIDKMAEPDLNWADFIGTQLLQIAINQRERLPNDLAESLDWAIIYAARLIQKRNVGPDYTNIAIMGTHVTIVTSEIYNLTDLNAYAMNRLRIFMNYTKTNGAFTEYNSPTYTETALNELGRMKMHAIEDEVEQLANELYHIGWEEVAQHYHQPTRQWSGPHSRSYDTLLTNDLKNFISSSVNGTWDPRLPLPIPDDLKTYFLSPLITPRSFNKTYLRDPSGVIPNLVGTTYLHPLFTIGSIDWGEMWNQRRPLIAYWGTQNKPSYLQLRFLHDNYDFSDIVYYSVQNEDRVLAGLVFATDGGDVFLHTDAIKNATIKAKDLRIRFQIGGNDTYATWQIPPKPTDPFKFIFNNLSVQFALPRVLFSYNNQSSWNVTRANGTLNIDYVLYTSNVSQSIKLDTIAEAAALVAVQISSNTSAVMTPVEISQRSLLEAKWTDLCLSIPFKPNTVSQLRRHPKFGCS